MYRTSSSSPPRLRRDPWRSLGVGAPVAALLAVATLALPLGAVPLIERAELAVAADRTAYAPGETVRLAAVLRIDEGWHVNSHQPTFDYLIPTQLEVLPPAGWAAPRLTYPPAKRERFAFAEEPLSVFAGEVTIVAELVVPAAAPAGEVPVTVTVTYQACDDRQCLPPVRREEAVALRIGAGGVATGAAATGDHRTGAHGASTTADGGGTSGDGSPTPGLLVVLALALLGGLVLNAMPCVLPVLSIKVFSLVKSAALSRRAVAATGLATSLGILVSFWALALAAVVARAAGSAVGWGVQFQQPGFVALLAVVVVLFALNLWGVFEIQLPQRLARIAGGGPQEGLGGHFASGLFATLMATPCSAPFLGTAVGFALAQPGPTVFAVFTAVGLGMASPYLLLAAWPRLAGLLPRPGAWMVRLKEAMGFLLAGAAVWLFYVLAEQVSPAALAGVQLALLALALVLWLSRAPAPRWVRRLAPLGALAAASVAVAVAAAAPPAHDLAAPEGAGLIAWRPWDAAEVERLGADGTPVFVDVTAAWCFTCKVNERYVLETPPVARAFADAGVVAMKADWTNRDERIGALLASHGRYGIPFYLLYRPGAAPHVFPELLTQEMVVAAVEQGTQRARR